MSTTSRTTDNKGRSYEFVEGDPLKTRIYTLTNGLKVYLSPNDRKPGIQIIVGVKAGSNDDPEDATGLAHYLEHLMFKGTKSIGTIDYNKEKPLLDEIEALFEEYGAETDPERRKEIYRKIDAVSSEASKMAIPQEFKNLSDSIGATDLNAATGHFRTYYKCIIPSTEVRRWAIMESERFINPVFRGFHTELETVYEEYNLTRVRGRGLPGIVADEVNKHLYGEIPHFQHQVIGKPEHLKSPSLRKLKEFYKTYYCANNMALILCGDLDCEETMDIIEEHFGKLARNESLPARRRGTARDLTMPVYTSVTDPGPQKVYVAWKIPGEINRSGESGRDLICIDVLLSILRNGDSGLLDDFVAVDGKAISADAFIRADQDYCTLYLTAQPVDGQSYDDLRDELLRLLDRLKSGDFEDARVTAAVNRFRKGYMAGMIYNKERAKFILRSFCRDIPYDRAAAELKKISEVTKEDLVKVARRYLTDGYVCVIKMTGPSAGPVMEKPEISPLAVAGDVKSVFARDLLAMDSIRTEPRFADFRHDLSVCRLLSGQELIYCHNDLNSLFSLCFISATGSLRDRWLHLADNAMDLFGTDRVSAAGRKMRMSELASRVILDNTYRTTSLEMSGLQENMSETLELATDWMLNAQPDEAAFREYAKAFLSRRKRRKEDFGKCQEAVFQLASHGREDFHDRKTITREQLDGFSGKDMVDHVHALVRSFSTITYHGPASLDEVRTMLDESALADAFDGRCQEPYIMPHRVVTEPEVMILDYDSPSAFVTLHAGWGATRRYGEEALYRLFNHYIDAIAFQEIREARSLAYSTDAGYSAPFCKGESVSFRTRGVTHSSKIRDYIETMEETCRCLPLSENVFSRVKEQLISTLRKTRHMDCDLIDYFRSAKRLGYDHDPAEDVYRDVQGLTLKDLEVFHRSHLADHPFLYAVVGKISELDMEYLKSKGRVRVLSKEDAFGY